MHRLSHLLAAALLALAAAPSLAQEAAPLEWKWRKGDSLRYRMTNDQRAETTGFQEMKASQKQTIVYRQEVTDVAEDGTASISSTYEAVKLDIDQPMMGRTTYDSTDPADKPKAEEAAVKPFASLVGAAVRYKVDRAGKVTEVQGFDEVVARAMAGGRANPAMADALKKTFGNEAMQRQLSASMSVVPGRPVKPGDSWSSVMEQEAPVVGTLRNDLTYTLREVAPVGPTLCARIDVASTITRTAAAKADPSNPMLAMLKLDFKGGKSKGEIIFDVVNGRIQKHVTEVQTDVQMDIPMGPPPAHGDGPAPAAPKLFQHSDQTVTVELIAKDASAF